MFVPESAFRLIIDGRRLSAHRTGVGRFLECLLEEWALSGLPAKDTRVILSDPTGASRIPSVDGLSAKVVFPGLPGVLWERFGLGRVLRRGDLLFAPTNLIPPNWRGPTVLVMFDALQEVRPGDFPRLVRLRFGYRYRRSVARARNILVPTKATAEDLHEIYSVPCDHMTVVHPAPDPRFRPVAIEGQKAARTALGIGDSPYFLFVGKRSRRRNVPAIADAFRIHRAAHPSHRLVFVGDVSGDLRGETWRDLGILDLGHVADEWLPGLMAGSLGVLYPSEHEGFGLPVVEAMAAGCPVVTLRRPALIEAGADGPIYLDEATPDALARAMDGLVSDPALHAEHVRRGLERASRLTMPAFADAVRRELRRAWDEAGHAALGNPRSGRSSV